MLYMFYSNNLPLKSHILSPLVVTVAKHLVSHELINLPKQVILMHKASEVVSRLLGGLSLTNEVCPKTKVLEVLGWINLLGGIRTHSREIELLGGTPSFPHLKGR